EISGPCSITSMFINALNPGPEGERAEGDLDDDEDSGGHRLLDPRPREGQPPGGDRDDDEDSGGHRLVDTVRAAENRLAAVNGELAYRDEERGRDYQIAPGALPFFMHRERGLHLEQAGFQ